MSKPLQRMSPPSGAFSNSYSAAHKRGPAASHGRAAGRQSAAAFKPRGLGREDLWAPPAPHEWWSRRAALGLGAFCVATGGMMMAHASVLQTPLGAAFLYAYESAKRPSQGATATSTANANAGTLHDWAVAQALAVGAQFGGVALISAGFFLALYAVH